MIDFSGRPGLVHGRAVQVRHDRQLRQPARLRVFPGLRQPRAGHPAHRQPARATTRITSARPSSRPLRGRCAWRSKLDPRSAGIIPSTKGSRSEHFTHEHRCGRRLRHGQPALGLAGGRARGRRPGSRCSSPRDPEVVRAAERVVLPGPGRHARLHARAARVAACGTRCSKPRRNKPLMGVCVGMQMLLDAQRGRRGHAGPGPDSPAEVRASELDRPAAARRQPLQGAADGLEPGACRRGRTPCGHGVPDES